MLPNRSRKPTPHRRPITDRWGFKPVAFMLLLAVVLGSAGLVAVLLLPPFLATGLGVKEIQHRLDEASAGFTRIPRLPQRSTIYASDGKTVLAHVYLDNREIVPLDEISPIAVKAVLAIEDSDFYHHGALNLTSLLRAAIENVRAGDVVQGGSTITQQLVKNTLEIDPTDKSLARKFQELALAQRVEQRYPKDRILALYLNDVFLGNNVYGIGTAARFYFHKPASKLTLARRCAARRADPVPQRRRPDRSSAPRVPATQRCHQPHDRAGAIGRRRVGTARGGGQKGRPRARTERRWDLPADAAVPRRLREGTAPQRSQRLVLGSRQDAGTTTAEPVGGRAQDRHDAQSRLAGSRTEGGQRAVGGDAVEPHVLPRARRRHCVA